MPQSANEPDRDMSWFYKPYVSAAQRRANAQREATKLGKKGQVLEPVQLDGTKIAATFWGKAWCANLESYSDYSNRLPRGRTYVRNGSVIDLQVQEGKITALVSGSSIYKISIEITRLPAKIWAKVQTKCAGQVDSLIELLQGKLSAAVMQVVTDHENGLFPKPAEIKMSCSCPDWAGLCKHLAACLYGIGARLDRKPDLLFTLRGVNPAELITASAAKAAEQTAPAANTLADDELSNIFGIEIDGGTASAQPVSAPRTRLKKTTRAVKSPARKKRGKKPGTKKLVYDK